MTKYRKSRAQGAFVKQNRDRMRRAMHRQNMQLHNGKSEDERLKKEARALLSGAPPEAEAARAIALWLHQMAESEKSEGSVEAECNPVPNAEPEAPTSDSSEKTSSA